jgi:hypothetical protein
MWQENADCRDVRQPPTKGLATFARSLVDQACSVRSPRRTTGGGVRGGRRAGGPINEPPRRLDGVSAVAFLQDI